MEGSGDTETVGATCGANNDVGGGRESHVQSHKQR